METIKTSPLSPQETFGEGVIPQILSSRLSPPMTASNNRFFRGPHSVRQWSSLKVYYSKTPRTIFISMNDIDSVYCVIRGSVVVLIFPPEIFDFVCSSSSKSTQDLKVLIRMNGQMNGPRTLTILFGWHCESHILRRLAIAPHSHLFSIRARYSIYASGSQLHFGLIPNWSWRLSTLIQITGHQWGAVMLG